MRKAYYFVLAGMLAWCVAIVATPIIATICKYISAPIYFFFHFVCHQLPERSFALLGQQLPVCARCTGLYLGALLGVLIYPIRRAEASKWLLLIATAPIALDGLGQLVWLWQSTNLLRVTTGSLLGLVAALFILPDLMDVLADFYNYLTKKLH